MKAIIRAFLFGLLCTIVLFPEPIEAGSHGPVISHYAPYRYVRPVCGVGAVDSGCVAPVRKSARFVGRVAVGTARAVGRVAVGAARVVGRAAVLPFRVARAAVRGTGRLLFARRCCRL
ncbi:MAG: hypothetical protein FJ112_00915 [Deltaproteobacteria bacterium]|nr:hypothetical protein [Deltaproteobacteria bacterium]